MRDTTYRINSPNVTSEEIDEEVIIVNLLSGNYYSTVDLGAFLWGRIQRRRDVEEMSRELLESFPGSSAVVERDLADFLAKLQAEGLIEPVAGADSPGEAGETASLVQVGMPASYAAPVLNCYSDMQDLLLLDPIHDVADAGWPTIKPDTHD